MWIHSATLMCHHCASHHTASASYSNNLHLWTFYTSPSCCNFAHCDTLPLVTICAMTYPLICVMTSDTSPTWITVKFTATFTAHQHWTMTFVLFYSDSRADLWWHFLCDEMALQSYSCIICKFFLNFATDNFTVHLVVWALAVSKVICTADFTVPIYSKHFHNFVPN